jgi:hypothetical protein
LLQPESCIPVNPSVFYTVEAFKREAGTTGCSKTVASKQARNEKRAFSNDIVPHMEAKLSIAVVL